MDQAKLNKANINDWEYDNKYEKLFQLSLTTKHALSVGEWECDGCSGVDLRRWSYDKSRNLGEGITLFKKEWLLLYKKISELNRNDLFSNYSSRNEHKYAYEFSIDEQFKISTGTFVAFGMGNQYFTINMLNERNKQVYRGWHAPVRVMIRFDTIQDFIINCTDHTLVPKEEGKKETALDPKTGKKIF